jgi:hypothetical protein
MGSKEKATVLALSRTSFIFAASRFQHQDFMTRRAIITVRIIAAIAGVFFIGVALSIWRLSVDPIEATYLTPYIESGMDHYIPGTHSHIEHTVTSWNNLDHVISLHATGITITDNDAKIIATIPDLEVQLSAIGLFAGRLMPLALTIDQPQIKLIRDKSGIMRFGDVSTGGDSAPDSKNEDVKSTLIPLLDDLTHASRTRSLNIKSVVLDVHDDNTQSDWSVHIPEIGIEHSHGKLSGHALLSVTQKDQVSTLQIQYNYNREKSWHVLQTTLTGVTPSFFAGGHPGTLGLGALGIIDLPLTGNAMIAVDPSLTIKTLSADIHGEAGNLVYPDFWDKPRAVKTVDLKAVYDQDVPQVNLAKINIDFDGPLLALDVKGAPSAVPEHDAFFEIAVRLDNLPMEQFADVWPKPVITNPRDWIISSLTKGTFDHAEAVFKGALSWNDLDNAAITEGAGKLTASGARVDYLTGMPPVDNVSAKATFDMTQMAIDLTSGGIGALRLVPFSILLSDFDKDIQNIYIPIKFTGPVKDVLKVIDAPKLQYAKAIGITPDDVTGNIAGSVELRLPLLSTVQMNDVDIKAHGDLTDIASSKLIKNIDITQGNVALDLDKVGFAVKGAAALNKIPSQITYSQNFNEEQGKALRQGTVTSVMGDDQWKQLNIDTFEGSRGPVMATVDLSQMPKESLVLNGKFDLTNAEVHVDQLNWKKTRGTQALLNLTVELPEKGNVKVKIIDLSGPQATVKGTAVVSAEGDELLSLNLNPLIAGRTNAALKYEKVEDETKTLRFDAEGQSLDISGLQGGHEVAAADPRPKEYHVHVDNLYTSTTGVITNAQGYAIRDPQGWSQIGLKGLADGQVPLTIDLGAKDGKRFFAAYCDNFGKALKGLGITDTVSDGKIQISGESTAENPRIIDGTVKISSFSVKGLPALVVLLNATSPFGFQNLISGNMSFDKLKGKFRWIGDKIDLSEVRIASPAVGIDVEGKVDMNDSTADLHGVVAPFSMVNNLLSAIPLIGDVLTGGDGGGVLAVAYTITGDLNKPKVSVNPASLLTPGFLRNLFFGGSDDSDEAATPPSASDAPKIGADLPKYPTTNTQNNFNK